MRQKLTDVIGQVARKPSWQVAQVGMQIVPVELGRLDQAHDGGRKPVNSQFNAYLAQVSFKPVILLNTGLPSAWSLRSTTK
jgi:hypothetical protein